MPACAKPDRRLPAAAGVAVSLLAAWLLGAGPAAAVGFNVSTVNARAVERTLYLSGNLDLSLTPKVEEAVGKGIPIEVAIEVRLYRQRPLIWDERVGAWRLRRELHYHALSGQYLIAGAAGTGISRESATSLNEALGELGALDEVALPLEAPLSADAEYRVDVRVALDIEALPALLRPVAYTSSAWDLNSGWTTWKVQR